MVLRGHHESVVVRLQIETTIDTATLIALEELQELGFWRMRHGCHLTSRFWRAEEGATQQRRSVSVAQEPAVRVQSSHSSGSEGIRTAHLRARCQRR